MVGVARAAWRTGSSRCLSSAGAVRPIVGLSRSAARGVFHPDASLCPRPVRAMTGPTDRVEEPDEPTDGDDDGDDLPVSPGAAHHRFTVDPERAGERIDALIAAIVPALSRASVQ